jgi:DNA polymerase-4
MIICLRFSQAASNHLRQLLALFSDRVELQEELAWLDVGSLAPGEAEPMAKIIGQAVRDSLEPTLTNGPAIGVAATRFTAQVAALTAGPNQALIIPAGRAAAFLADFPVSLLPLDSETARRLKLLGIARLGQLAAIPAGAILSQFGPAGRLLRQLARGHDPRPVLANPPLAEEELSQALEEPVADLTILSAILRSMVEVLSPRLQRQGRLSGRVALALGLESGSTVERSIALRQPTASPARLSQSAIDLLQSLKIQSPVQALRLTLSDLVIASGEQLELFAPQTGHRDRLQQALPSLIARYGDCFYQVSLLNEADPLPERRFQLGEIKAA